MSREDVIDSFVLMLEDSSVFDDDDMREYFEDRFPNEPTLTNEEIDNIQSYKIYVCNHCMYTRLVGCVEVISDSGQMFCSNDCYEDEVN